MERPSKGVGGHLPTVCETLGTWPSAPPEILSGASHRMVSPEPSRHRVSVVALLFYTAFIVYQSVAGGGAWQCSGAVLAMGRDVSRPDVIANVVAYVPLGLLLVLVRRDRWPRGGRAHALTVLAGTAAAVALLSLVLELVQSCQAARVSSGIDWIANTCGGAIGALLGLVVHVMPTGRIAAAHATLARRSDRQLRAWTAIVVLAWIAGQAVPWVFQVDVGAVRANLAFLRHWNDVPLDWWKIGRHAGAWLAIAAACRLTTRDAWTAIASVLLAAATSVGVQVILQARSPLSFDELIGMTTGIAIAVGASVSAPRASDRLRAGVMWLGAAFAITAYELQPGPPLAATQAFSWLPRVGLGRLLDAIDYAWLFAWFGLVAVVAQRWARRTRGRSALWTAAPIGLALVLEVMQTGIPGRGPDLSAPVFTLLAVLATMAMIRDAY